jgi:hypothetical protein
MNNLIPRLQVLVKNLGREDLTTVEALLVDMTGSRVAAQMLERLLLWWPKAKNPDGWVYKSQDEWWAELRVKANELTKAKGALEMAGVIIQVKQAAVRSDKGINGWAAAPVRHYRLDVRRFLKRLAAALATSIKKLASLMKKPFAEGVKNVLPNGQKTITTSLQTNLQTSVVVNTGIQEAKKVQGISEATAQKMVAQFGAEAVARIAPLFQDAQRWRSPSGAFCAALRENWQFAPVDSPTPLPPSQDDPAKWEADEDEDTHHDIDPDADTEVGEDTEEITPVMRQFNTAIEQVRSWLPREASNYLKTVKLAQVDGSRWIVAGEGYAKRMLLDHRLRNEIAKVGRVLTGDAALVVELAEVN